jgi:membrane-bound lytic murein transglycosylase A
MGELLWISADAPVLAGAVASYRRLVVAVDSGGAIRGAVRVDLYLGRGAAAGIEAGRVRHPLKLWRLVPKTQ